MPEAVITGGARTAVGRLLGSLKDFTAADLGGIVIRAALERSGLTGTDPEYVIMGQVLQAGAGQIPARQAAVAAGIPMTVPAITINKVCLSGLDAIALAAQLIRAGEFEIVVAGGMESMTGAPHLLPGSRAGYKYGSVEMLDSMARDGLTDAFDHSPMAMFSKASVRPSWAIASSICTAPYLKPSRDFGSRCGALVIDSMPPATTTSNSPARMSWSASAIASRPDRQTLFSVRDGTDIGMPPATAAGRAGFWPAPAWRTWPMIT